MTNRDYNALYCRENLTVTKPAVAYDRANLSEPDRRGAAQPDFSRARSGCAPGGCRLRGGRSDWQSRTSFVPNVEAELGERATARLVDLLNGFSLQDADRDEDKYGRKLRVVTRDEASLGETRISEGLAEPGRAGDGTGAHPEPELRVATDRGLAVRGLMDNSR
jgi:hypothetical protein